MIGILRYFAILIGIVVLCMTGLVVYTSIWDSEETEIWKGLEAMSQPTPDPRPFASHDIICVAYNTSELLRERNRLGRSDVYFPCLGSDSNDMMFLTVKNGNASCKQTDKFRFIPAEGSHPCTRIENLVVRKKTYSGDPWARHWGITRSGTTYFEIGKQP
ncbi:MAG: hypothetical protein A4S14_04280 [Proteobacteria bacterium SG_bin9]|nr:MAG: hypothetical protein A4S14_04280 [Proteobacteria bacterium SG_bin9]